MRIYLILFSLVLVSCKGKGDNAVGMGTPFLAQEKAPPAQEETKKEEPKPAEPEPVIIEEAEKFATIDHANISLLRNKILNKIIEEKFPIKSNLQVIKAGDENVGLNLEPNDAKIYPEKEKTKAKIVVSYPLKTEIFFAPEKVALSSLNSQLDLIEDGQHKLKWINGDSQVTSAGGIYYLVSVNHEELAQNDLRFFNSILMWAGNGFEKKFILKSFQKLEMSAKYEFYLQQKASGVYTGESIVPSVNPHSNCTYRKNTLLGGFERTYPKVFSDFGFGVKRDNQTMSVDSINLSSVTTESFKAEVTIPRVKGLTSEINVFLNPALGYTEQLDTNPYEFSAHFSLCRPVSGEGIQIRKSQTTLTMELKVSGRGEDMTSINL